jgi:hypothetical protein
MTEGGSGVRTNTSDEPKKKGAGERQNVPIQTRSDGTYTCARPVATRQQHTTNQMKHRDQWGSSHGTNQLADTHTQPCWTEPRPGGTSSRKGTYQDEWCLSASYAALLDRT